MRNFGFIYSGALAFAAKYSGKLGGSPDRLRMGGLLSLICGGIFAINVMKVAEPAYKKAKEYIDHRSLGLINNYLNQGATAICKKSRR